MGLDGNLENTIRLLSVNTPGSDFPPPEAADEAGLLCWGGKLNRQSLVDAYSHGIFPWPHEGYPLLWFSPPERGVLRFDEVHIPRSLVREYRRRPLRFTTNQAFQEVMSRCAEIPRRGSTGTWITPDMRKAYESLHGDGLAHSLEAWSVEGDLVGGIYGVYVGNYFSAESMFGLHSNVSKRCLLKLVEALSDKGLVWMDIQMVTPVTQSLGAKWISRDLFLKWISGAPKLR